MSTELKLLGHASDLAAVTGARSLCETIDLKVLARYSQMEGGAFSIASTDADPFTVNPGGITAMRLVILRALDGQSVKALITTPAGGDQVVPVSDLFVRHAPLAGDEITSLKLVGSGAVELLIAGDKVAVTPPPLAQGETLGYGFPILDCEVEDDELTHAPAETVIAEFSIKPALLPPDASRVLVALTGWGYCTDGQATFRIRLGGAPTEPRSVQGDEVARVSPPISWRAMAPIPLCAATIAKPGEDTLLQVTVVNAQADEQIFVKAATVVLCGVRTRSATPLHEGAGLPAIVLPIGDGTTEYPATGTDEKIIAELDIDFDDLDAGIETVVFSLGGWGRVGGGRGTWNVRVGGETLGDLTGSVVVAQASSDSTDPARLVSAGIPVPRPAGSRLVRITELNSTAGQDVFFQAGRLTIREP